MNIGKLKRGHRDCVPRGFKARSGATQAASHWLGRAVALAVSEAHGRWCELEGGGDWVLVFLRAFRRHSGCLALARARGRACRARSSRAVVRAGGWGRLGSGLSKRVQAPRRLASHWLGRAVALAVREAHGRWCGLDGGGDWVPVSQRAFRRHAGWPRISSGARSRLPCAKLTGGGAGWMVWEETGFWFFKERSGATQAGLALARARGRACRARSSRAVVRGGWRRRLGSGFLKSVQAPRRLAVCRT